MFEICWTCLKIKFMSICPDQLWNFGNKRLCWEHQPSPRWNKRHCTVKELRPWSTLSKALSMNFFPGPILRHLNPLKTTLKKLVQTNTCLSVCRLVVSWFVFSKPAGCDKCCFLVICLSYSTKNDPPAPSQENPPSFSCCEFLSWKAKPPGQKARQHQVVQFQHNSCIFLWILVVCSWSVMSILLTSPHRFLFGLPTPFKLQDARLPDRPTWWSWSSRRKTSCGKAMVHHGKDIDHSDISSLQCYVFIIFNWYHTTQQCEPVDKRWCYCSSL